MSKVSVWFHDKRRMKGKLVPFVAKMDRGASLKDRVFVLSRFDGRVNPISYESWQAARRDGWAKAEITKAELAAYEKEHGKKKS